MEKNLYEILGVEKNASAEDLKKAYRQLSKKYHPDLQNGKSDAEKKEAEDKFKEINAAYATLSDPEKRSNYDNFGTADSNGFGGNGFNPFEFFRSHFGGNPFGDDFGFGGFTSNRGKHNSVDDPENGDDVQIDMTVNFKDLVYGATKEFDFIKTVPCTECHGRGIQNGTTESTCSTCNGKGQVVHTTRNGFMMSQTITPCPDCHGTGRHSTKCPKCHGLKREESKQKISVKIPQGIRNGQQLKIKGAGECGLKGGENGDIYIRIISNKDSKCPYERIKDLDLKMEFPLNPIIATIGGKVNVETPWGIYRLEIPAGTQTGQTFTIPKHGMKYNSYTGDLIVVMKIMPFYDLSDDQINALKNFNKTTTNDNVFGYNAMNDNIKSFKGQQ